MRITYPSKCRPYGIRHPAFTTYNFGAAPSRTRALLRDTNAGPLHDGPGLSTAAVCGLSSSCAGEPTAFTRHFLLVIRRTVFDYRERHKPNLHVHWTPSSPQQFLLLGDQPLPQPPHLFYLATQMPPSVQQPPTQPPCSAPWADEVAAAEQSGHSTPETVVPN